MGCLLTLGGNCATFSELRQLLLRRVFFRPFQTFPELPGCLLSYSKNIQNNVILFFLNSPLCRIRIGRQSHHSPYVRPVISEECQNFMTPPTPPLYVRSQHLTTGFTNQKATTWPDQKYLPIQIPSRNWLLLGVDITSERFQLTAWVALTGFPSFFHNKTVTFLLLIPLVSYAFKKVQ